MVTVELVYSRDCPNVEAARTTLRHALTEVGLAARWREWEASSDATPVHLRRYGSPTVLVNGRDVAGAAPGDASSCRVYEVAGTRSGAPASDVIVRALVAAGHERQPGALLHPHEACGALPGVRPEQSIERKEVTVMATKRISLCPGCDACPSVVVDEHEVRIGEAGNLVTLSPAEWNVLVQAIRGGDLREV